MSPAFSRSDASNVRAARSRAPWTGVSARPSAAHPASGHKVKGRSSPGATVAAVAAYGLTVAVALLDDHADVGLHQLGDVHDLQRKRKRSVFKIKGQCFVLICIRAEFELKFLSYEPFAFQRPALGPPRRSCRRWAAALRTRESVHTGKPPEATAPRACTPIWPRGSRPTTGRRGTHRHDSKEQADTSMRALRYD